MGLAFRGRTERGKPVPVADIYGSLVTPLLLAVILIVFSVGIWLFIMRRLRSQKSKLNLQLKESPTLVEDRAFNRIRIAQSESEILERAGTPSVRGKELLQRAQEAYDARNFTAAVSLADSAHSTFLKARHTRGSSSDDSPPVSSNPVSSGTERPPSSTTFSPIALSVGNPASATVAGPAMVGAGVVAAETGSEMLEVSPSKALPKNRAESHFQITVLSSELFRRKAHSPKNGVSKEADSLRQEAQSAYDRGQYTQALTLALRGRRRLGTLVETLPPPLIGTGNSRSSSEAPMAMDVSAVAAMASEGERCSTCGFPVSAADRFCRGCGAPRRGVANCPKCGLAAKPGDAFCGSCGSPMA